MYYFNMKKIGSVLALRRCSGACAVLVGIMLCFSVASAQTEQKSDLQTYHELVSKGQMKPATESAVKVAKRYYTNNLYKEAFDLLRGVDQNINTYGGSASAKATMHYLTSKERMNMYMRMKRGANVKEHLNLMESYAAASGDEAVKNDLLYNKAIYYYTFGQAEQGNAVFKQMAGKLTASKEYDKVDKVYQELLAGARRSGSAGMVAQAYGGYMAWKDSVSALKRADETAALNKKIAEQQASMDDKDSALTARQFVIIALGVLLLALVVALILGAVVLLRYVLLTRKQKKNIKELNEDNALKAGFISNISAQLEPTLKKLDATKPEVKALLAFSEHVQTLSELDSNTDEPLELEDTNASKYCEALMDEIRKDVAKDVVLTVNAPAMTAKINRAQVSHILLHLLKNAAEYTPEGGKIWLEYKKQSAHKHHFQVTNTGESIPEERRENLFKAFSEIRDLTTGDGLGLPICHKMAERMNGELALDSTFTKGTRFVLTMTV